jgi:hypothetical protein
MRLMTLNDLTFDRDSLVVASGSASASFLAEGTVIELRARFGLAEILIARPRARVTIDLLDDRGLTREGVDWSPVLDLALEAGFHVPAEPLSLAGLRDWLADRVDTRPGSHSVRAVTTIDRHDSRPRIEFIIDRHLPIGTVRIVIELGASMLTNSPGTVLPYLLDRLEAAGLELDRH